MVDSTWSAFGIIIVGVGFVELLIARIVNKDSIGSSGLVDQDPIRIIGLINITFDVAVLVVMKVTDREQLNSCMAIYSRVMDQYKLRHQFIIEFAGDHVHHAYFMADGIIPENARYLFFVEISE